MEKKTPGYPLPRVDKSVLVLGFNKKIFFLYTHTNNKRRKSNSEKWAKLHLHWPQGHWIRDRMGSLHNRYREMHSIKTPNLTILTIEAVVRWKIK